MLHFRGKIRDLLRVGLGDVGVERLEVRIGHETDRGA
jgi:hypothetical protein